MDYGCFKILTAYEKILIMPYAHNKDLPKSVSDHCPPHAQTIYREAFNHAHETYKDSSKRRDSHEELEILCHKVAWSAVKKKYEKGCDNHWHLKKEKSKK
jgi:cation transport regulator